MFAGNAASNNLINPGGIGNLFDTTKHKLFDVFQPVGIQPLFGVSTTQAVIKSYDAFGESQKSIKAVQDSSKKFFNSLPSQLNNNFITKPMLVDPGIDLRKHMITPEPVIPSIPFVSQITTDTPPVPVIPSSSTTTSNNNHDANTNCEWCTVKGIYYGAKHVIVNPTELQKPANFINKHIGKAFIAGEIVGGAIACGYYGSQGVNVEDKLKQ